MKKLRIVGIIFLLFIGLIVLGFITGFFSIPSIKNISNRWGNISENTIEIISSITIENNNPFKIILPRVEIDYNLKMNNITMASGKIENIHLQKGDATIEVSSYLDNTKIPEWWVSHIENNESTIVNIEPVVIIDAEFTEPHIETPKKTIPINTDLLADIKTNNERIIEIGPGNLVVKSVIANWGNITNETTELLIGIMVNNSLSTNIPIPKIYYRIKMNNITIGNGTIKDLTILKANNYSTINLATKINNYKLDDWFISHLQNNEHSILEITINTELEYEKISYIVEDFLIYIHEFNTNILGHNL